MWRRPCTLVLLAALLAFPKPGQAQPAPSGEGVELEYTGQDGTPIKTIFPIYKTGDVRYFSAGMGTDERAATYPAFALKLIFVGASNAYLAHVAVTIMDAKGMATVLIPDEQVTGPWLFIDLPAGTYDITAIRRDRSEVKQRVEVKPPGVKTVHFRWKE